MPRIFQLLVLTCFLLPAGYMQSSTEAAAARFYYTTVSGDSGTVEVISVDPAARKLSGPEVLYQSPGFSSAKKLRQHPVTGKLLAASESEPPANLVLLDPDQPGEPLTIHSPKAPDELRSFGSDSFIVAGDDGWLGVISGLDGAITHFMETRKSMSPTASKAEDLLVLPEGDKVLVSFQKDSKSGKHLGHRLAVFRLPELSLLADVQLPRDRPELHMGDNPKEQGPSPEILRVFPEQNTVVVTLDLYGALAFMDYSALLEGKLENYQTVETGSSGQDGNSFPDRVADFFWEGKPWLLVSNASSEGMVLVDVKERKAVQRWPKPAGAEAPVVLREEPLLVATVTSGKLKSRSGDSLEKEGQPKPELRVYQPSDSGENGRLEEKIFPLPGDPAVIGGLADADSPLVVVGLRDGTFLLMDPRNGEILDRAKASGRPVRIIPGK